MRSSRKRPPPTKEDIIAALREIGSGTANGRATQRAFMDETGWSLHWFDKYWPVGGYQDACAEAGVKRGAIIGVEVNTRVSDAEVAIKFAEAIQRNNGRVPKLRSFSILARMGMETICRGESYPEAKRRIIAAYFDLPNEKRKAAGVDRVLHDELARLNGKQGRADLPPPTASPIARRSIHVPHEYIALVREFRDRAEEEKRQLVAQFFYQVLGYKRARVRSEHEHNDVRVSDRHNEPWLVVEVKSRLESARDKKAARRQGFDYAHWLGVRFVVVSDGDYYEVFDRCAGERLRYEEMRAGNFQITALRSRDDDLLVLLGAER